MCVYGRNLNFRSGKRGRVCDLFSSSSFPARSREGKILSIRAYERGRKRFRVGKAADAAFLRGWTLFRVI